MLETMSGEWKGFVRAPFTLHGSTACCWLYLPRLGPAYAGAAARRSAQVLHQLPSALRLPAGRLQQGFPKRVPAFLLTRFCPFQAAEVLIFLLKVSAKLGHPGAPTLRIIVI